MTQDQDQPLRAIIYVRLSSHRGETDPSTSPARQEESCRAYCKAKGWDVADVVRDLDVSGSDKGLRLDRPGLHTIRKLARDRRRDLREARPPRPQRDRLPGLRRGGRDQRRRACLRRRIARPHDAIRPVRGNDPHRVRRDGSRDDRRADNGRHRRGPAPRPVGRWQPAYGLRIVPAPDGPGHVLAPDPDTAPIVREAADRALSGDPLYKIARDLNERGVPTQSATLAELGRTRRKPSAWSATSLRRLLVNPAMVGRSIHRGELIRAENGLPRQLWEPVLPLDDWRRLSADLAPTSPAAQPRQRTGRLLSGLAKCGRCFRPLYATSRKLPDGGTRPFYACSAKRNGYECDGGRDRRQGP
jgi:site-specific DNA recombinase